MITVAKLSLLYMYMAIEEINGKIKKFLKESGADKRSCLNLGLNTAGTSVRAICQYDMYCNQANVIQLRSDRANSLL